MSADWPVGWPAFDWPVRTQLLTPDVVAQGDGLVYVQTLVEPLWRMDERNAALFSALVDLDDAHGGALDLRGDGVGERRHGLRDAEYRAVIAGRLIAQAGGVIPSRVAAAWRALTRSDDVLVEPLAPCSVHLEALVREAPSDAWLLRAGRVLRAVVGADGYVSATVTTQASALYDDELMGYDVGAYAYDLITEE